MYIIVRFFPSTDHSSLEMSFTAIMYFYLVIQHKLCCIIYIYIIKNTASFHFFSHGREIREKLVLRHYIPYTLYWDIICWVSRLKAVFFLRNIAFPQLWIKPTTVACSQTPCYCVTMAPTVWYMYFNLN